MPFIHPNCPREHPHPFFLRCSGATYNGQRITAPHDINANAFRHHGRECRRGRPRCLRRVCEHCRLWHRAARERHYEAINATRSAAEIRRATHRNQCAQCFQRRPSADFPINHHTSNGLSSRCYSCLRRKGNS